MANLSSMPIIREQTNMMNFQALSPYTGDNPEFSKQLVLALLSELDLFLQTVKERMNEDDFLNFRRANHSISPSLQMLEMRELIDAIDAYKSAYINSPASIAEKAVRIKELVQLSVLEAKSWINS
jgi:HPt (histidine-containing phosphotransfer) domain-containing protein